jgi:hypothetical protein
VVGGGAGVDEGPRTKAEAAAKSKIVGSGVAEAIEKAQDGNASSPVGNGGGNC